MKRKKLRHINLNPADDHGLDELKAFVFIAWAKLLQSSFGTRFSETINAKLLNKGIHSMSDNLFAFEDSKSYDVSCGFLMNTIFGTKVNM